MPRAKWCLTTITNFIPKELGEPSTPHSGGSQIFMKSIFLLVGKWLPQLLWGENAITFEDTLEMENKNRTGWRVQ
jgi:hypothetical protein